MESDIGAVAAYVFAQEQAIKAMQQMLTIIEDGQESFRDDGGEEGPVGGAEDETELVQIVCPPHLQIP
jgi:hypothetical protein